MPQFKLISFELCPFVQRSVITLREKGVDFEIAHIDLGNKPDWFLALSPLGKVPVLVVDGDTVLFESAVINEYLDEVTAGRMLPEDPLRRAYGRAWIEFASNLLLDSYLLQTAKDEEVARTQMGKAAAKLAKLEEQLPSEGPFFYGEAFSLVDSSTLPALQRLGWMSAIEPEVQAIWSDVPKVVRWRDAMLAKDSVKGSLVPDIDARFRQALIRAESWVGRSLRA